MSPNTAMPVTIRSGSPSPVWASDRFGRRSVVSPKMLSVSIRTSQSFGTRISASPNTDIVSTMAGRVRTVDSRRSMRASPNTETSSAPVNRSVETRRSSVPKTAMAVNSPAALWPSSRIRWRRRERLTSIKSPNRTTNSGHQVLIVPSGRVPTLRRKNVPAIAMIITGPTRFRNSLRSNAQTPRSTNSSGTHSQIDRISRTPVVERSKSRPMRTMRPPVVSRPERFRVIDRACPTSTLNMSHLMVVLKTGAGRTPSGSSSIRRTGAY